MKSVLICQQIVVVVGVYFLCLEWVFLPVHHVLLMPCLRLIFLLLVPKLCVWKWLHLEPGDQSAGSLQEQQNEHATRTEAPRFVFYFFFFFCFARTLTLTQLTPQLQHSVRNSKSRKDDTHFVGEMQETGETSVIRGLRAWLSNSI